MVAPAERFAMLTEGAARRGREFLEFMAFEPNARGYA